MWHVSIGLNGWHVRQWSERQAQEAERIARDLLKGVGDGQTFVGWGDICFHARRRLADAELVLLSDEWKATPAVDVAGELREKRR